MGLTRVMSLLTKLGAHCRLEAVVIATSHRLVPVGPIGEAAEKDRLHRSGSPKPSLASPWPAWSWLELPVALILARLRFGPNHRKQQTLHTPMCADTPSELIGYRNGSRNEDLRALGCGEQARVHRRSGRGDWSDRARSLVAF
jgi:hypothetical protein